jgi:hypothetical protein
MLENKRTGWFEVVFGMTLILSACGGRVIVDGLSDESGAGGAGGFAGMTTTAIATTSGVGSTGGGASASCSQYCADIMAECQGMFAAQYPSMASCLGSCAAFPPGKPGDKMGHSLACRAYYAAAAKTSDSPTACIHAGPTGGDKDQTDNTLGDCGNACEGFCDIALKVCAGPNPVFKDRADCQAACMAIPPLKMAYSITDNIQATNNLGCRTYHLTVAATDAASAATHCPHIGLASPTCK